MTASADLTERIAFDRPIPAVGPGGVVSTSWAERHVARAEIRYAKGAEVVEAARLEGRPIYKLRIRQCRVGRDITTDWRARDCRRGTVYAIVEVDAVTDRNWIYLVIEGGRAA